ncbi:phospholipase D-like domain-containing protein [Actinomadura sp. 3N407]|uniref:phospholipase D-like domain-containing protein n=1 Tax=Actinomadura sp. 3N407 TaxID=3457423 RepID=UPI003FCE2F85
MYLMVDPNGNIFRRKEISGWFKVPTSHHAASVYLDATMIYDGSILAINVAGQLHLLATPSGPAEIMNHALASRPHAVATLLDGTVLVLTAAGTLHWAGFARGPWTPVPLPPGVVPTDIAVTPDGHLLCLTAAGAIHQAADPGVPRRATAWAAMAAPPPANVERIEYLHDGSLLAVDNANAPHLLPANQINAHGAWQALPHVGPILSVTPLGGHTLLAIDPADNRFMTADALPENWVQVPGPAGVPVLALAHLRTGHVAALGNDGLIYQATFTSSVAAPPAIGAFAPLIRTQPPVPPISMTANPGGKIVVVGDDHRLYTWETAPGRAGWSRLDTGPTRLRSVTFLEDGVTMYGVDRNNADRHICWPDPTSTFDRTAPWTLAGTDDATDCVVMIKDGSVLEVTGSALHRRPSLQADRVPCGWAGPCVQVVELATDPADTQVRTRNWLLEYTLDDPEGDHGDGRPWGDGTQMARRAKLRRNPWDAGSRVTPLIGGFAALSAMRDAFEAAIIEANASPDPPGRRGYVYLADWLFTPLRDLSEDNPWGGGSWTTRHQATRDQTAIGLIARMMSAGIKVRVLVWMPTTTQAWFVTGGHARQHWHLARMVQELNDNLKAQGGVWAQADDLGVVALDLRTAPFTAVSLHQKMCVVRVGDVNVGFCGGVDLAYTRRDFRRPADGLAGAGDWQSGDGMPVINDDWPKQHPAPLCGYPTIPPAHSDDVIADELGSDVYGTLRHWHDQHLKLEGPIVASLEEQFDERWRLPGRPFHFDPRTAYGNDDQVQFTSAEAFQGQTVHPLPVNPCEPVGSAVVQLWRTIPVDDRRRNRSPFGRGEFTVMAGICKAVQKATQLITIWDQYFWSVPLSRLLAERLKKAPDLKVLIVLPPYGSNSPKEELWYRKRALQALQKEVAPADQARVVVFNAWSHLYQVGVYVHAKVQTYDDCLLVCGSANMNRRSFTLDMELDCAVLHKPDVSHHLANLAHMLTGRPWLDFDYGWLQRFWTHVIANAAQTTVPDPFYGDPNQLRKTTPNGVPYAPRQFIPEIFFEPTSVHPGIETVDADQFPYSPGTTGRLDQIVWLLEWHMADKTFPFRYPT